jgi:hypothetical protein
MGTWGIAVSSNDSYADIYSKFFNLYNEGTDVHEISEKLISSNRETIEDTTDCNNFWFALAKCQWECKQLDPLLFSRVKEIISSGADIDIWKQLDASEADIRKRKVVLEKFLNDLQKEKNKAKARRKKIIRQPPFDKGDCLTFKLADGNYGGAVVLEATKNTEFGYSLIAVTRIHQVDKPTRKDFEKAEILIINYPSWNNQPVIRWYSPIRYKSVQHLIEKVATINCDIEYLTESKSPYGFVGDFVVWFINPAHVQFEHEKNHNKSDTKITVRTLTLQNKQGLWQNLFKRHQK